MYKRMLTLPLEESNSLFLFGPRGTGKTQWIRTFMPQAIQIDLLDFNQYKLLQGNPAQLAKIIPPNFKDWIVIDEVQRIPELLNEVHRLIELKNYRFLLTGSSARSLKRKGVNLLAGRALRYHMHPLTYQELNESFNLHHALNLGLLPATFNKPNAEKYLETYVETYLREEVLQEGLTRNVAAFTDFLKIASFSQGSVINTAEISREIGINHQVVTNYFTILEDMLLATRLPVFNKRAKRRLITKPKFYYFDTGVFRHLRTQGPLDSESEMDGSALETLVFQNLRAINDYLQLNYTMYYWRTSNGTEVDFVLYGKNGLLAFEVKRSRSFSLKDLRGLKSFKEDYPPAKLFFIYQGEFTQYQDDIIIMPIEEFLKQLPKILSSAQTKHTD